MYSVEICKVCQGVGSFDKSRERDYETVPCGHCRATGRVYVLSYRLELAFGDERASKIDGLFIETIRKHQTE